jgi:uncharacterized protein (TIGR02391 family)
MFEHDFPALAEILEMEPEELAPLVLRYLKKIPQNSGELNRYNFGLTAERVYGNNRAAAERFFEAWMWLEGELFLAPRPGDTTGQWFFVTRRGEKVLDEEDFNAYRQASRFPSYIDPVLVRTVKPLFMRGDYDTAVFRAFKEVEVRVRRKAKYGNDKYGRDLMVQAFGPNGPLTNQLASKGEQDAMRELFAGAISQCKNPSSHREVKFDDAGEGHRPHLLC